MLLVRLGQIGLGLLGLLSLGAVFALTTHADGPLSLGAGDLAALRFTLVQALLSATVSVALAIPLARALARRAFPGRGLLILALGAPFILPVIVAIFGLLAVWGRAGGASDLLAAIGLPRLDIYGLQGVVLAHVFFNLPLVTRLLLQGWAKIPPEQLRLAAQLGFSPRDQRRHFEWPLIKAIAPGAFMLVFILASTSFATVLALGGGPKSTSIELAIYTAIRFEFDLGRAALLAMMQVALGLGAAALLLGLGRPVDLGQGLARVQQNWNRPAPWSDALIIVAAALFLFLPLLAVALRGIAGFGALGEVPLARAVTTSLAIAALSTALAVTISCAIAALAARSKRGWLVEAIASLTLIISPFVLGTGLFIVLNPIADPFALAVPVTALVNAALTVPFCVRVLIPGFERAQDHYGRLARALGMSPLDHARLVLWPALRAPLGFAAGIAAAFSMGDLGVITLFAPVDGVTLPLLMFRLMGSYQMEAAAAVGLILVGLSVALFALFDIGGRLGRQL